MEIITLLLLVAAFILFILAAIGVGAPRFNLVAAGLACWVLTALIAQVT
jgi:hypothetical protein